jgi:hypothetical protein
MCAISDYIQRSDVEDSEKKNREKRFDCSKVDTYKKRNIFSMCARFSILVFSNLELLQKRSISRTQKTKNN